MSMDSSPSDPAPEEAPFVAVPDGREIVSPLGPLVRPLSLRMVLAGAALVAVVTVIGVALGGWWLGPALGLAMLVSAGVKRGIAALDSRRTRPLPRIFWFEPLRLVLDLGFFLYLLGTFAALLR